MGKHLKINLFLLLILYSSLSFSQDVVRFVNSEKFPDPKQSYFVDLLRLTLEASKEKFGPYQLQGVAIEMAQGRTSVMLERNEYIDVAWRMTSKILEQHLQAVYFPLLKGMMGYRIFIIRKNDQQFFNKHMSLQELKLIPLGQGYNWPDTDILINNGFNVARGYDNYLLKMLARKRFDFFPRAIHEPWIEIKDKPEFMVEKNLMLQYPAPIFFFVNKSNKRLQQRLDYGLGQLLNNGTFEQFFLNHPITAGILQKADVKHRTIFKLENPLLSEQTKKLLKDKRLWINIEK